MARRSKNLIYTLSKLDDIEDWASKGATEGMIATKLGISRQTFLDYKKGNPGIFDAIKKGKSKVIADVRGALYKRAMGFAYSETKTVKDSDGNKRTEVTTKQALPDVAAANLLLKNYDREEWSNDPQMLEIRKQELALKEKQIEANNW